MSARTSTNIESMIADLDPIERYERPGDLRPHRVALFWVSKSDKAFEGSPAYPRLAAPVTDWLEARGIEHEIVFEPPTKTPFPSWPIMPANAELQFAKAADADAFNIFIAWALR